MQVLTRCRSDCRCHYGGSGSEWTTCHLPDCLAIARRKSRNPRKFQTSRTCIGCLYLFVPGTFPTHFSPIISTESYSIRTEGFIESDCIRIPSRRHTVPNGPREADLSHHQTEPRAGSDPTGVPSATVGTKGPVILPVCGVITPCFP